ncbi:NirD/YgiW/YdeI family stress tolerance protein [Desulfosarcina sp. OttesenSCG-928-G17]|nr:NirD/YgiW/YdeI family stress tolerance protein [Desulfosarcina sp. OttesenSCG-928-G17]
MNCELRRTTPSVFRKIGFLLFVLAFFLAAGNAMAQSGFTGPGPGVANVDHAKSMGDDEPVVLEGNIVQHLGGERYLFQDASGTVTVDIDDDKWRGFQVGPEDRVRISGEVDKDWNKVEIDVDSITKVTNTPAPPAAQR